MNQCVPAPRAGRGGLLLVAALFLLPPLAACGSEPEPPPLAGAAIGGPFTLTDQDGRRVSDADFDGRYRLVYFGFTNCPDVCPVDLQVASAGLSQFEQQDPERAGRVQPIFITVDPARDTPARMKAYLANFHDRMIGLTGSSEEIDAVLRAFGAHGEQDGHPGGGYDVYHSRYLLLMGPRGEPIAIVPREQGPAGVARELDRWVS